ncbi:YggS family pyridoxal phosphate enzyme [Radiomyces spectabilis]|uniref:YggS family pyridoxal phosphate enzyme n=1 Tax=Radiomyces spectabilis TaxID=64574 RepID=UPI00221E9BFA|nr:YggS family pyridoxal phosphate enzyme [Radiomyces spectabilis]KAI8394335.1 YggS family pyridoxal phosphate enzyme [Radiomyces spectabilis]
MSMDRRTEIIENLNDVRARVAAALDGERTVGARLVAVSKYKPAEDLMYAYDAGQRHFGENYLPRDIQWHFIGTLQSNKCKAVAVERTEPLRVFVQVNTSAEEVKGGIAAADCAEVCKHIIDNCPQLKLCGLMTIGMFGRDPTQENPDFQCLADCKAQVQKVLPDLDLELSMGMSEDYEKALKAGSTNIRVGRTIFGERPKKTTKA